MVCSIPYGDPENEDTTKKRRLNQQSTCTNGTILHNKTTVGLRLLLQHIPGVGDGSRLQHGQQELMCVELRSGHVRRNDVCAKNKNYLIICHRHNCETIALMLFIIAFLQPRVYVPGKRCTSCTKRLGRPRIASCRQHSKQSADTPVVTWTAVEHLICSRHMPNYVVEALNMSVS